MPIATISTKGQITLPAGLRKRLGIKPHDRVAVEPGEGSIVIKPIPDFFDLEGFLGKSLPPQEERNKMRRAAATHARGHKG